MTEIEESPPEPVSASVGSDASTEKVEPAAEATAGSKKPAVTVRELIAQEIATLDKNLNVSLKEKRVTRRTLRHLEASYGVDALDSKLETQQQLEDLRAEIQKTVDEHQGDRFIGRKDIRELGQPVKEAVTTEGTPKSPSLESLLTKNEVDIDKVNEAAPYLSVDVLYRLEDLRSGVLLEIFTQKTAPNTYVFNFKGNIDASSTLGLNMFFKHQPEVRELTVTASTDREKKVENGIRQGLSGNFIDASAPQGQQYVEVLDGYTAKVTKRLEETDSDLVALKEKQKTAMQAYEKRKDPNFNAFMEMVGSPRYADVPTSHIKQGDNQGEKLLYRVIEASANAGIDPYLTMSLLKAENGTKGRFFGVLKEEANGFEAQLDWALKLIQEYEVRYPQPGVSNGGTARDANGRYTVDFLAYFSEIYSPSQANNPYHFNNLCSNYFSYRGEAMPQKTELKELYKKGYDCARSSFYVGYNKETSQTYVSPERIEEALNDGNPDFKRMVPGWSGKFRTRGSLFGYRIHPVLRRRKFHTGLDVAAPRGTDCKPWKAGTVEFAGKSGNYGNLVIINHGNGVKSYYAHFKKIPEEIKPGTEVSTETQIGLIGSTGMSTGPHLHFEIRIDGTPINPLLTHEDLFPEIGETSSSTEATE